MRALSVLSVAVALPALAGCATDGREATDEQIQILAKEIPPNAVLWLTVLLTGAVMTVLALAEALRGSGQEDFAKSQPDDQCER